MQCLVDEDKVLDARPEDLAININGVWHKVAAAYRHEGEWQAAVGGAS